MVRAASMTHSALARALALGAWLLPAAALAQNTPAPPLPAPALQTAVPMEPLPQLSDKQAAVLADLLARDAVAQGLTDAPLAVPQDRDGRFVNPDFGEYHVAVSADVPQLEVHFVEDIDDSANPVGAKGVGELGISGAGAAVVNAIHRATGIRVRDMPVTLDKLLAGLPAAK